MLVAAALVPDTALLVPGTGGTADIGAALRAAALDVTAAALAELPASGGSLVVVAPGRRTREVLGQVRGTLGPAGVPDDLLGWPVPVTTTGAASDESASAGRSARAGTSAAVALHLLAQVGCSVPVRLIEAANGPADLLALGADLVAGGPTVLLVVGSGSGRHGPDAPQADDPAAAAYDAALLADLAAADAPARLRLADLDGAEAQRLAVTGWAPWRVLMGAVGAAPVAARVEADRVLAGAQHAALLWRAA